MSPPKEGESWWTIGLVAALLVFILLLFTAGASVEQPATGMLDAGTRDPEDEVGPPYP